MHPAHSALLDQRSAAAFALGLLACATLAWAGAQPSPSGGAWEMRVCADPNDLPMSHMELGGYELEIAEVLANELGAELTFDWYPIGQDMIDLRLRQGECDLIMGVLDASESLLTTIAYYRTTYVFVYLADSGLDITSLDSPELRHLRIGTELVGIPPHAGLLSRGALEQPVRDYGLVKFEPGPYPYDSTFRALVEGEVDVLLAWGPRAAYYAARQDVPLKVVPVTPVVEPPLLSQATDISIGVRLDDRSLADRLSLAIARRWDDIQRILADHGVPLLDLPRPQPPAEGVR